MDNKDDRDKHKVSDDKEEKMKRSSSSSGSCEVDAEMMNNDVSVHQDTAPTAATHKCNLCGKTFSSGKALGGHRRSHFQAAKKKKNHHHPQKVRTCFSNHSKEDSNNNRARPSCGDDDDNDEKTPTCYLCKKQFKSKKALYGHMTHHSHEHKNSSNSSHNSDSSMEQNKENHQDDACVGRVVAPNGNTAIDLSKSTSPSWKKTDKRGRKCIGIYKAAEALLHLRAGCIKKGAVEPPPKSTEVVPMPSKKRKIGESSSTGEERVLSKIKFLFSGSLKLVKKSDGGVGGFDSEKLNTGKGLSESGVEKISVKMEGKEDCGDDVNESSDKMNTEANPAGIRLEDHVGLFYERKVKKGKKSKKTTYDANGTGEKLGCYNSGNCGSKSFPTFQGLGGHKSIHKEKNLIAMDESKHYSDATVAAENNSCSSILVPKVEEETLVGEAISQSKFDFDLNEPYVMED